MLNFKFTWGHGIVIALLCFIGFILGLVFLFPIGKQNSDLVSQNYYEDELAYQDVIDAKNYANLLPQKPLLTTSEYGIKVSFPKETHASKIRFYLYCITDSEGDLKKEVDLDQDNEFIIPKKVLTPGTFILKLYWVQNETKCQIDFETKWN